MVIAVLKGGLGNQMFQYAMARTVAQRRGTTVKVDLRAFESDRKRRYSLDAWNVNAAPVSRVELLGLRLGMKVSRKLSRTRPYYTRPVVYEQSSCFDPDALRAPRTCLLVGYWQSEGYFQEIESTIRQEFTLRTEPRTRTREIASAIRGCNSVFVHIRRGDYLADPEVNEVHGTCSMQYYEEAASYVGRVVENPHFFAFSDEPEWLQQNLKIPFSMTVVDHNEPGNSDTPGYEHEDLWLMAQCRHAILANSSFSWWGAWLNPVRERVVIAPKQWVKSRYDMRDLIPDDWIRI